MATATPIHPDAPTPRLRAAYEELTGLVNEAYDLARAATLLGWDELCMMPSAGRAGRADQKATLERLVHARITDPRLAGLTEELRGWAAQLPPDSFPALFIGAVAREHRRYAPIPADLVTAMSRASSTSYHAWVQAKAEGDFSIWERPLAEVVTCLRELCEVLGYPDRPYDALLDRREPGISTRDVEAVFAALREELLPFIHQTVDRAQEGRDGILAQRWDLAKQRDLGMAALRAIGFDLERGRVDTAVHPISYSVSPDDVRLAVRFDPERITPSFFSFLHEGGHGIYFQGVPGEYRRTPLDGTTAQGANLSPVFGGIATSLHEGQSRLWENVLGRSHAFWVGFFPVLRRTFPSQTRGVQTEDWYRAINQVRLSHVRIAADELTYDLHIMLRFEIEAALVDGDLAVADLPSAWNELAVRYLGSAPDDLRQGPLQDIQWSRGGHGGFPSYTLGNVISMQLWSAMERGLGSLDTAFAQGDYLPLRDWMRANVHSLGAAYAPREVLRRATGSADLDAGPYITYLKSKFGALYDGPDTRH